MNELLAQRQQKDAFFKSHPHSPLTPEQREEFTHLNYFPPNPDLELEIEVDEFEDKAAIMMQTTTGGVQEYLKWGTFSFAVDGETAELIIFYSRQNGHFFLPFMDATNGEETYSGGRYIDPVPLQEGHFYINFNLAYAPYCAYNDRWTCAIPPRENRLKVRIEAGEKNSNLGHK